MNKERFGLALLAVLCGSLLIRAQQNPTPPATPQGGRAQGQPGGGRGGRGRPPGRKVVLAWADTRNGIAQHDSVSHALATIERLGYESGLWDTYIRTDSNIASYHPLMTTGQPASGGPSFTTADAIFFMGHREVSIDDQQKADLLKFVHDDGKGFVAAHVGLTALMSWPEFGEMLGGQFQDHPYGSVAGTVINEDPTFPATRHLPALFNLTDEFYQVKGFSREKSRVLLRLDTSKLPPNQNLLNKDGDFPLAWAKMYGQGRVFYGSFAHDAKTWDNPDVYHMYFEAIKWALKLTDADVAPRPLPATAPAGK
jgi:type 1 glutamine amidotransferase